jgi:hypothetical protein
LRKTFLSHGWLTLFAEVLKREKRKRDSGGSRI